MDIIKIALMYEIYEADINKQDKLTLLEVVKSLDSYQTMGFALDYKVYNLNESGKQEIQRRFINEGPISFISKLGKKIFTKGAKVAQKSNVEISPSALKKVAKLRKLRAAERVAAKAAQADKLKKAAQVAKAADINKIEKSVEKVRRINPYGPTIKGTQLARAQAGARV